MRKKTEIVAVTFKELAEKYGVSEKTLRNYIRNNYDLTNELNDAGWSFGTVLFKNHQEIIAKYLEQPNIN